MDKTSVTTKRLLVVGRREDDIDLSCLVHPEAQVQFVSSLSDALRALQTQAFDLVVCPADEMALLQGSEASRQAEAIIEGVNQGLCIVSEGGDFDWANPKLLSFPEHVRQQVSKFAVDTFRWARSEVDAGTAHPRGRRFSFSGDDQERYDVNATPVIDLHERVTQVAAVVTNTTDVRRLQNKIDAIDRAGRELLSLDVDQLARLDVQERLSLLEQKIIHCTKELLHFDNFEIRVIDKKSRRLDMVLAAGMPTDAADSDIFVGTEGNGICGYVAARGASYICPDSSKDSRYLPGIENARSSLTVPLFLHERVIGVANFESTELAAFTEDARQFAEIFARYIALSLHMLELLVSERRTTTGQVGSDVMAEITGPLNDILTDVENLVEDYIGHDDLRHRLRTISTNAVRIRESIKELTSPTQMIRGLGSTRRRQVDPLLTGKHILIAEDEDTIRETIRDVLLGYGCEVSVVADGAVAVSMVRRTRFDLVISDIKMPGKDGYQVFEATKETSPETPVILTTGFGYDPNHAIVRARREGLTAVLFKPFKVDQLLGEMRMALRIPTREG